jgi:ABC-type bacteriocin/lantibiotic exporter with double-glycine peptidase domain
VSIMIELLGKIKQAIRKNPEFKVVFQSEEAECGLACLTMLLDHFGAKVCLNDLRPLYGSTRGGINVQDMIRFSKEVGLRLICQTDIQMDEIQDEQIPCIALWENSHFIVITSIDEDIITYNDPNSGKILTTTVASKDAFQSLILLPRIIKTKFKEQWKPKAEEELINIPIREYLSAIGVVSLSIATMAALLASIFQVSSAQIQDVFFDWILQMQLSNWARPLGWIQIGVGITAAASALAISLVVAIRYTDWASQWNLSVYRRLLALPESFFLDRRSGEIISKFESVDEILGSSQESIVTVIISAVNVIVLFFVLSFSSGLLAVIAFLGVLSAFYWSSKILPIQKAQEQIMQQAENVAGKCLYNILSDLQQIRMEGREYYYLQKVAVAEIIKYRAQMRISWTSSLESMVITAIDSGISAFILVAAAFTIIKGNMSLGQYAAINVLIGISLSPLLRISPILASLQKTRIAYDRLAEFKTYEATKTNPYAAFTENVDLVPKGLTFNNVTFQFSMYSQPILDSADISIKETQFPILISSKTGEGKSTLAKLIAGRLSPSSGIVALDGVNISEMTKTGNQIPLIDGKPYLIQSSILENIRLGSKAPVSNVFDLADELGFSTLPIMANLTRIVMDSTNNLSGGELLVIQLLRILLQRPRYLILDEVFSAISPRYHKTMADGITKNCPNSIFINHLYPSTLSYKSNLKLTKGRLINADL